MAAYSAAGGKAEVLSGHIDGGFNTQESLWLYVLHKSATTFANMFLPTENIE